MTEELLASMLRRAGRLVLDRPRALNALTWRMCDSMDRVLQGWSANDFVQVVFIEHMEGRAFCAGGDIKALAGDPAGAVDFFRTEYALNERLASFGKPTIAFMDGITMGGGVGISLPATYRVATERTRWAMPETRIGFFPDVGGGWHLSRLAGRTGEYLGLTGATLDAADCLASGIATHHIPSADLERTKELISRSPEEAGSILDALSTDPGASALADARPGIDQTFAAPSVSAIRERLSGRGEHWARAAVRALDEACPTSLAVTLDLIRSARTRASFADEMTLELALAGAMVARNDFHEGVRAVLVDRDGAPRWNPPSLADVPEDALATLLARGTAEREPMGRWAELDEA